MRETSGWPPVASHTPCCSPARFVPYSCVQTQGKLILSRALLLYEAMVIRVYMHREWGDAGFTFPANRTSNGIPCGPRLCRQNLPHHIPLSRQDLAVGRWSCMCDCVCLSLGALFRVRVAYPFPLPSSTSYFVYSSIDIHNYSRTFDIAPQINRIRLASWAWGSISL